MSRDANASSKGAAAAFVYRFDHAPTANGPGDGASHASDIPFVFHILEAGEATLAVHGPEEVALSNTIATLFMNMASTGDPNTGLESSSTAAELPAWPRYDTETDMTLQLDTEKNGGCMAVYAPRTIYCDFWDTIIDLAPIV